VFTAVGSSVLVRSFNLALSVEGLKPHTVDCYVRDVERLAAFHEALDLRTATSFDLREYFLSLSDSVSPKTVYEAQLAVKRFYKFLVREGEIERSPAAEVKLVRYRVDPQPTYTVAEVKRLLLACKATTPEGVRDRALVTVLFDTGVREGELVSMGLPDWQSRTVRVDGKGGVRVVPLGTNALQAIDRYVRRWDIAEGKLWRGRKGPLTESGVFQMMKRLCDKAGVERKGVHAFRRAAAAQMKRLGMQDSDILEICGWKDVTMLRRYVAAVADELAQDAHRRYSPGDAL